MQSDCKALLKQSSLFWKGTNFRLVYSGDGGEGQGRGEKVEG